MDKSEIEKIVRLFWYYIDLGEFDRLSEILDGDVSILLPNTKEVFDGASKYIEFNKIYPGRWFADIERLNILDCLAITTTKVRNENCSMSFYVTSYFTFDSGRIIDIVEYWAENTSPPQWRIDSGLSRQY